MDYGFAPGNTKQDIRLRTMFSLRSDTRLIDLKEVRTVQNFFDHLRKTPTPPNIQLPASNLVVGSHANAEGHLFIGLDAQAPGPIDYDTLDEVEQRGGIKIPPVEAATLLAPGARFHFKGCRIGSVQPFIELLKTALGGVMEVTAPKYFHGLYDFPKVGVFEYMSHQYDISRKEPFKTRAEVVEAFKQGINNTKFQRYRGGAVPDGDWEKWIPKPKPDLKPTTKYETPLNFPVKINPPVGTITAIHDVKYDWRVRRATWVLDGEKDGITFGGRDAPTEAAAQMAAFKLAEGLKDYHSPNHPYPVFRRLHYNSFDEFVDGHTWSFTAKGEKLTATGTRYVYTLVIPIVKPGTSDELVYNFHSANDALRRINFDEDNTNPDYDFFGKA